MNDIKGIIEDVEKSSLVSNKVAKKVIEIIGQEKWQDINDEKSDICTTTGELIITLKGIVDLEKENAELKEKYVKNITDCDICDTYCNSQLTKAKEIIKEFMKFYERTARECYSKDFQKTLADTEQFLSEVENV